MRPWVRVLKDVAGAAARAAVLVAVVLIAAASDDRRSSRRRKPPPSRRRPLTKLPPDLTLEVYCSTLRVDGGQDAILLLARGIEWMERWDGRIEFGKGPHAPLYLVIPDRAEKPVKAICVNTGGEIGVLYRYLKTHPPFDEERERRDLTMRLNRIQGIKIPPGRWNGRAYNVKLDALRDPASRHVFFDIFDDVARRLQEPRP